MWCFVLVMLKMAVVGGTCYQKIGEIITGVSIFPASNDKTALVTEPFWPVMSEVSQDICERQAPLRSAF